MLKIIPATRQYNLALIMRYKSSIINNDTILNDITDSEKRSISSTPVCFSSVLSLIAYGVSCYFWMNVSRQLPFLSIFYVVMYKKWLMIDFGSVGGVIITNLNTKMI